MMAMTAWEGAQHRRATDGRTRCRSSLERLPKSSIRHLYREWVTCPRQEAKGDMVSVLWRFFQDGAKATFFWADVRREWDYVERCKAAVQAGQPKPLS